MSMKLNPNIQKRKEIGKRIVENKGFCPCMLIKNEDTKCPCKKKREEEICICGLYIKEE